MQMLLPSQRNHQLNAKTAKQLGEDVCKPHIGQGVKSPKMQSAHTSPQEKHDNEILGKRWKQRFLPRRSKESQQVHENLITIIKSQANANPNCKDIAGHCGQNGYKEPHRNNKH